MMRHELRAELCAAALEMSRSGLSRGTSGNLSARAGDSFLITPTGMAYESLATADLCELAVADGRVRGGRRAPSSEWRMHMVAYQRRPDLGAIVHTHSMFATTLSINRMDLPAVHYMLAVTGADVVRCAAYATFGTQELAEHMVRALEGSKACLLANHGLIAAGATLAEAFRIAREVETVAEQYWRALQVGRPVILDADEMARVRERFASYGQPLKPSR